MRISSYFFLSSIKNFTAGKINSAGEQFLNLKLEKTTHTSRLTEIFTQNSYFYQRIKSIFMNRQNPFRQNYLK